MRISDWSSDVCSSDLGALGRHGHGDAGVRCPLRWRQQCLACRYAARRADQRAVLATVRWLRRQIRSEEHTSELQSLMRISYAVFCFKKTNASAVTPLTFVSHTAAASNSHITSH